MFISLWSRPGSHKKSPSKRALGLPEIAVSHFILRCKPPATFGQIRKRCSPPPYPPRLPPSAFIFRFPVLTLSHCPWGATMCRNIRTLFNFEPPVTEDEIRAASLQFVRKISGFTKPSKANEAAFLAAVDEVAAVSARLLHSLETTAPPKNREEEAAKTKERAAARFGD